ncbi:MAG: HlyD family efflux transporter periplasmic adaptor subunit [Armatimonadetes bacterium]|nr:HlyD family efflux transporter periplasmic adaptor subunit [Armatimonadota bacterium]MDE2207809.1 HlyD family efflux transporter periplasmic adaptor subunit [Armatimonadota bacterium]
MKKKLLYFCALPFVVFVLVIVLAARVLLHPTPKAIQTDTATTGNVSIKVVETGTIEPLHKVDVKSRVAGRISVLYVDEGASVAQGQVLGRIDPQQIDTQVNAQRAQLESADARIASARKSMQFQLTATTTGVNEAEQNLRAAAAALKEAEIESAVQPKLTTAGIQAAAANLASQQQVLNAQEQSLKLLKETTNPQAVVSAQVAVDQAKAQRDNARLNMQRQHQLLAKGFVSAQAVDQADTDYQVAQSHLQDVAQHLALVRQANALQLATAEAQVAGAQQQVRQMRAALNQARSTPLNQQKVAALESARATYLQDVAQLEAARSQVIQNGVKSDAINGAVADAAQIQQGLQGLLVNQRDTTILAPMSGVVTKRFVEAGELVTSGIESFNSGTAIFEIADLAKMLVTVDINEVDVAKVRRGMLAEVTIDAAPGVIFTGHVLKVAPAAIGSSSDTGTSASTTAAANTQQVIRFEVKIQMDHADRRLKPGMSARCSIIVARRRSVVMVPNECVTGTGANATVQVLRNVIVKGVPTQKPTPVPVVAGLRGDEYTEIVSGLKAGDKVVPAPYTGPPRKTFDINAQMGG